MSKNAIGLCLVLTLLLFAQGPTSAATMTLEVHDSAPAIATTLMPAPHPILSDLSVRQAIAHCTNRDALVAAAYPTLTPSEREALIADSFIPQTSWAYTEPATTYDFDPAAGQALLETAGWTLPPGEMIREKDGRRLTLTLTSTTAPLRIAFLTVFEAQMSACGIEVKRNHTDEAFTHIFWRDFEVGEFAWVIDPEEPGGAELYACDAIPAPESAWTGNNAMGWCNAAADAAIALASDTTLTQPERKAHYETFIDLFAEDLPSLPLFFRPDSTVWEHIDLNLETYLQEADVTPAEGGLLSFMHYSDWSYGTAAAGPGTVTQTMALGFYPLVASLNPIASDMVSVDAFRLTAAVAGVPMPAFVPEAPITVTLHYPPVVGMRCNGCVDEATLALYRWDGGSWVDASLSCPEGERYVSIDLGADVFVAKVCQLSEFRLMGEARYWVYLPLVVR